MVISPSIIKVVRDGNKDITIIEGGDSRRGLKFTAVELDGDQKADIVTIQYERDPTYQQWFIGGSPNRNAVGRSVSSIFGAVERILLKGLVRTEESETTSYKMVFGIEGAEAKMRQLSEAPDPRNNSIKEPEGAFISSPEACAREPLDAKTIKPDCTDESGKYSVTYSFEPKYFYSESDRRKNIEEASQFLTGADELLAKTGEAISAAKGRIKADDLKHTECSRHDRPESASKPTIGTDPLYCLQGKLGSDFVEVCFSKEMPEYERIKECVEDD